MKGPTLNLATRLDFRLLKKWRRDYDINLYRTHARGADWKTSLPRHTLTALLFHSRIVSFTVLVPFVRACPDARDDGFKRPLPPDGFVSFRFQSDDVLAEPARSVPVAQSAQSMLLTAEQNNIMRLPNYSCFMHHQVSDDGDGDGDGDGAREWVGLTRE